MALFGLFKSRQEKLWDQANEDVANKKLANPNLSEGERKYWTDLKNGKKCEMQEMMEKDFNKRGW
jgi:hypothetical protein